MTIKILAVDSKESTKKKLEEELIYAGYEVQMASCEQDAAKLSQTTLFDAMIIRKHTKNQCDIHALRQVRLSNPKILIIVISNFSSIALAVKVMKLGANEYISETHEYQTLLKKLTKYLNAAYKADKKNSILLPNDLPRLIGTSEASMALKKQIMKIKDIDATVLLTGESGTGKSVVAKEIHASGRRHNKNFIHVDCASLPPNLIESELFGYEKGSFTSANESKKGKFEQAGDGTIFLDEIGSLPSQMQSKLLNVLQERAFTKIGGTKVIKMEARVIAATNEDLEAAVKNKTFREDLYYRLNVVRIECPPLRNRKEDISLLASHFIGVHSKKMEKEILGYDNTFIEAIHSYDWPGNIRELENVLESIIALSDENILTSENFPRRFYANVLPNEQVDLSFNYDYLLKNQEIQTIQLALNRNRGNKSKAAQELGISRRTLYYKLQKMNADYLF